MEYFNVYNAEYVKLCKSPYVKRQIRLCILDHYENVIYSVTNDVEYTNGSVSIEYQQGVRRTCSLTMRDIDNQYFPSENSPFWILRKFKIYAGLYSPRGDIYWFSQGVFFCQEPQLNEHELSIKGVDKFGIFTEALNTNINQGTILIKNNSSAYHAVLELLQEDLGNGLVTDPIEPYIDNMFYTKNLPYDITINEGGHRGDILKEIATCFCADIFYDNEGHLVITKQIDEDYRNYAPQWIFSNGSCELLSLNTDFNYTDVVNMVTVWGSDENGQIYRYTEKNDYPSSPIRVSLIGSKPCEPIESAMCYNYTRCRDYAAYEIRKQALLATNVSIQSTFLPHLNVNQIIKVEETDINVDLNNTFIVQGLTIPLSSGEMQINCCNATYLEDNYETSSCIANTSPIMVSDEDFVYYIDGNEEAHAIFYRGTETNIIIPKTLGGKALRYIESTAFTWSNVTEVQIPSTVISIG